jgi:hypothetical protein
MPAATTTPPDIHVLPGDSDCKRWPERHCGVLAQELRGKERGEDASAIPFPIQELIAQLLRALL